MPYQLYNNIGSTLNQKGEYDKALEYFQLSLMINLKTLGDEHTTVGQTYNNIGLTWNDKSRNRDSRPQDVDRPTPFAYEYDKALEYFQLSLSIFLKTLGEAHPSVALVYNNIGLIWANKSEYDKALEYFQLSLAVNLKILGEEHPSIALVYLNLGNTWGKKSEFDRALLYFEMSLEIYQKTLSEEHPIVAELYLQIGLAWSQKGESEKALEFFKMGGIDISDFA